MTRICHLAATFNSSLLFISRFQSREVQKSWNSSLKLILRLKPRSLEPSRKSLALLASIWQHRHASRSQWRACDTGAGNCNRRFFINLCQRYCAIHLVICLRIIQENSLAYCTAVSSTARWSRQIIPTVNEAGSTTNKPRTGKLFPQRLPMLRFL